MMREWFGNKHVTLSLLFRGSKDGFNSDTVHKNCDGKEKIMTMIKSDKGKIFGSYQSLPLMNKGGWVNDKESFLFSLSQKTKH